MWPAATVSGESDSKLEVGGRIEKVEDDLYKLENEAKSVINDAEKEIDEDEMVRK